MAKYLVTGGAGFIGTNIVKKLLEDGHEVHIIDNYAGGRHENRVQPGGTYIDGDITNWDDILKACEGVDGVFHLAALPRVPFSVERPKDTHDVNITGTLNVLLAARDAGAKRVVFSSSSSVYGNQETLPLHEEMHPLPVSPYALHKLVGEHNCRLFFDLYDLETVALRYFNVYGPYFDPEGAYALVIGKFLKQRNEGLPMTVCGDGEYYRDYTHVADIVNANILAMTSEKAGKGEVINIGNSRPFSVNQLVKEIGGEHVFVDPRPGDVRKTHADWSKAKELLGWEPTISLEDGIAELKRDFGIE